MAFLIKYGCDQGIKWFISGSITSCERIKVKQEENKHDNINNTKYVIPIILMILINILLDVDVFACIFELSKYKKVNEWINRY